MFSYISIILVFTSLVVHTGSGMTGADTSGVSEVAFDPEDRDTPLYKNKNRCWFLKILSLKLG